MVTTLSSAVRVCGFLAGVHLLGLSVEAASLSTQWQHHTRDVQPGVSEQVIELDVPVLIINTEGELELAEGLDTVQVVQEGCALCQQNLMTNSFANSYGAPYVGTYAPPSCDFNRVTWNMTVVSNGTQYDRLGTVWLGDVEVLRTSTAEPGGGAIGWTYLKDMTPYLSLFRQEQKFVFDLGNSVTATDTAAYIITLTATYYVDASPPAPADLIVPISKRLSSQNQSSAFSVPGDDATNTLLLSQNVRKAIFSIAATGQDTEEFWWSNVLSSDVDALPDYGELYGYSPFREIQLFIDDSLVGVAWPFPIVFTGAVISGLWSPVVGIDVFDLKEDEVDITPWLPILCDGQSHVFRLNVVGLAEQNGTMGVSDTVGSYWLLSGKIFLWFDQEGHVTTGTAPQNNTPPLDVQVTSTGPGGSGNTAKLYYQVNVQRTLEVTSTVYTSNGMQPTFWRQNRSFSNLGNYTEAGKIEVTQQQTTGLDISSAGFARQISYPFEAYTGYSTSSRGVTIAGTINRGKNISTIGEAIFGRSEADTIAVYQNNDHVSGAAMNTYQNANGTYFTDVRAHTSTTSVANEQWLSLDGLQLYDNSSSLGFPPTSAFPVLDQHVKAINGSVVGEVQDFLVFTRTIPVASQKFEPPRLPGRGYRGRHISELELNVTVSV